MPRRIAASATRLPILPRPMIPSVCPGSSEPANCFLPSSTCSSNSGEVFNPRSEEHTSELQSRLHLVCRLLLEKKKKKQKRSIIAVLPYEICILRLFSAINMLVRSILIARIIDFILHSQPLQTHMSHQLQEPKH